MKNMLYPYTIRRDCKGITSHRGKVGYSLRGGFPIPREVRFLKSAWRFVEVAAFGKGLRQFRLH
jgi:hypothetical protein